MLVVDIEKAFGGFSLRAAFSAEGGCTALFGASGAGKTTIVNVIAGLTRPDRGRIVLDGEVLFDAVAGVDRPVWRRRIGYVFQDGRLFPHLSVKRNLDYGRWIGGHPADDSAFARVVALLDIGHLLERRPGKLSGGERQRVAIGRALLTQPAPVAAGRAAGLARCAAQGGNFAVSAASARRRERADDLRQPRRGRTQAHRHARGPPRGRPRDVHWKHGIARRTAY